MKKNITTLRIRYAETDQMGVVYYGNYAQYFEQGRTEWLRNLGITYKLMEEKGVHLPVINLNINYKKPTYYDDVISITTTLKKIPTFKIEFDYQIHNQDNLLLATGSTDLVFVSIASRKLIKAPEYLIEKIIE